MTQRQKSRLVAAIRQEADRIEGIDHDDLDVGQLIKARMGLANAVERIRCELAEQINGPQTFEQWERYCGVKIKW